MSQIDKELANKILKELVEAQKISDLSPEAREKIDKAAGAVAGDQLSDWLPDGWVRKVIMLVILLAGLYGAWRGQHNWLYILLVLPIFSPRLMGWAAYLAGCFSRGFNSK